MRARLLIDSELALWALAAPARLSRELREWLDASEVYVSAVSILEIGLRTAAGPVAGELLAALEPSGFRTLAVTAEHAALAAGLAGGPTDPLDRLLVAQATVEGMTLVTTDVALATIPAIADRAAGRHPGPKGRPLAKRQRARGAQPSRRARVEPLPERCRVVLASAVAPARRARG